MTAPKHTTTEREQYLAKVAKLNRMGWHQHDIARECGVSQPLVCKDLKILRERYREHQVESRDVLVNEKLAQLRDIVAEAHKAWEESKKDAVEISLEEVELPGQPAQQRGRRQQAASDPSKITKKRKTIKGRLPDDQYLAIILKAWQAERELLGLDAPTKTDAKLSMPALDWGAMASSLAGPVPDMAARRIEEVLRLKGPPPPMPPSSSNGTNGHA